MIENLVFDMGGILVYDSYYETFAENGFTLFEVAGFERILYAKEVSDIWEKRELGELTAAGLIRALSGVFPEYDDMFRFAIEKESECISEYGTTKYLKSLHDKGYGIYILSNYAKEPFMEILGRENFDGNIDGYVVSCDEKVAKPDKRIFEMLYETYGLNPSACLFFDDRKQNIEAAEETGMQGIWIYAPENLEWILSEICSDRLVLE